MISYGLYKRIIRYIYRQLFRVLFSSKFKKFGNKTSIISPDYIQGEAYISLGDHVVINSMAWLLAFKQEDKPHLSINDNVSIGRFFHIVALKSVVIEKNVLIADKVYISDNIHGYEDIKTPIIEQAIVFKKEVIIGENSWIGENVSIIGAQIGRHCVIGANSVVTQDIPDYSIAVGSPAKVIKQYDFEKQKWQAL